MYSAANGIMSKLKDTLSQTWLNIRATCKTNKNEEYSWQKGPKKEKPTHLMVK